MSARTRIVAAVLGAAVGLAAALVVVPADGAPAPRTRITAQVAATAPPSPAPSATPAPTEDSDTAGMDPGCSRSLVREVVDSFIGAFNRGDERTLARLFGPQDDFMWFSVVERHDHVDLGRWAATYDISALPAYFASRQAAKERLSVRELLLAGGRSGMAASQVGFGITLARSASDRPAEMGLLQGKATVRCDTRTIKLWAVAVWHSPPGP